MYKNYIQENSISFSYSITKYLGGTMLYIILFFLGCLLTTYGFWRAFFVVLEMLKTDAYTQANVYVAIVALSIGATLLFCSIRG